MGLFNFFKKDQLDHRERLGPDQISTPPLITSEESREALPNTNEDKMPDKGGGLERIYAFLQADFESKGYNDALIHPDERYKTDNFSLIKYDLQILLHQVDTYHDDLLRELDFHIQSRSRAGLIDLVEQLKNRKEMVHEHVRKVMGIKEDLARETGMTQRVMLSYQRGFMKGLSAITQSNILDKQF